jgi:hypothetical protein
MHRNNGAVRIPLFHYDKKGLRARLKVKFRELLIVRDDDCRGQSSAFLSLILSVIPLAFRSMIALLSPFVAAALVETIAGCFGRNENGFGFGYEKININSINFMIFAFSSFITVDTHLNN